MHIAPSILVAALAGVAQAQMTPRGFEPAVEAKLEVMFNSTSVGTPGQLLSKASKLYLNLGTKLPTNRTATTSQPQLAIGNAQNNASATYMFVMLDLDVPPQEGSNKRRVLLHALNTGFKATQQKTRGGATLLATTQRGPAPYLAPGPPATDTIPHRYVELLFQQPANLNVPASAFANTTGRFNFDIAKFMTEHKLSKPVAGNFFMVDGKANGTAGRGTATGTGGAPRRTSQPFEGAAAQTSLSSGLATLFGLSVLLVL